MTRRDDAQALVALGANLPIGGRAPGETLRAALAALPDHGLPVLRASRIYATPCFPPGAGPDYANAACAVDPGGRDARAVLAVLHAVEAAFRRRRGVRWGRRTLDLDLIAMGDAVLPDPETAAAWRDLPPDRQVGETPDRLILPHPRVQDRAFVLVPLLDVAPGWRHPALGLTVAGMAARLPAADLAAIRSLPEPGP